MKLGPGVGNPLTVRVTGKTELYAVEQGIRQSHLALTYTNKHSLDQMFKSKSEVKDKTAIIE